jgi:hypothetical protein
MGLCTHVDIHKIPAFSDTIVIYNINNVYTDF